MLLLSCVIFAFAFINHTAAVKPTVTVGSNHLEKRNDAAFTVTMGPLSNYIVATPAATTLAGRDFKIARSPDKSNGIDLYFGPDLADDIKDAVAANCPRTGIDWANCQTSVAKLISPDDIDKQRRDMGWFLTILGTVVGPFGIIIESNRVGAFEKEPVPKIVHIHIPAPDVAQFSAAEDKPTAIFLTATDDPNPATVVVKPTPIPVPKFVWQPNGQVSLHLDKDFAARLDELITRISGCARKRTPSPDCQIGVTMDLMRRMEEGGIVAPIALMKDPPPIPAYAAVAQTLLGAYEAMRRMDPTRNIEDTQTRNLVRANFLYVAFSMAYGPGSIRDQAMFQHDFFKDQNTPDCPTMTPKCSAPYCKGENGVCTIGNTVLCPCTDSCPGVDRTPGCEHCGGSVMGQPMCKGLIAHNNLWHGCDCIINKGSVQKFSAARNTKLQLMFKNLPPKSKNVEYYCSGYRGNAGVIVDPKEIPDAINQFCQGADLTELRNQTMRITAFRDPKASGDSKMTLVWTPKAGWKCAESCTSIFTTLRTAKNCAEDKKASYIGALLHRCGTANWAITTPSDPK